MVDFGCRFSLLFFAGGSVILSGSEDEHQTTHFFAALSSVC